MISIIPWNGIITSAATYTGDCGEEPVTVTWTYDSSTYTLTITGEGEMYNYHSGSLPPWNEVKDMITTVIVEEGITSVGSQTFRKCNNISSVTLPDGLEIIGNNAFSTCKLITELVIPRSVKEIHKYAFANISAIKVIYEGTLDEWSLIGIGVKNESITQNVICE